MVFKLAIAVLSLMVVWVALPLPADQPICRNLKCWYDDYNRQWFDGRLPAADVSYGSCPIPNVVACSWVERGHAYVRLIPKYNLAPDGAHFNLLHEMCHIDTNGMEVADHGPHWQACMHRLADEKAFEGLW